MQDQRTRSFVSLFCDAAHPATCGTGRIACATQNWFFALAFSPVGGTAPRTHAGSSTCRARTRQKHSRAIHGLYRIASALCRTYRASHPRIVDPGLPPWASFCRAYGAHATLISHSCVNRTRLERESGTLGKQTSAVGAAHT